MMEQNNDNEERPIETSSATITENRILEEVDDDYVSPYCPTCESCGFEGCCNFIQCFNSLIVNEKCTNGRRYLADARFHFRISQLSEEIINYLENGSYDAKTAVELYRKEWDEIRNNVYKNHFF